MLIFMLHIKVFIYVKSSTSIRHCKISGIMTGTMRKGRRKRILISVPLLAYQHRQGIEGILRYVHENKSSSWETYLETEMIGSHGMPDLRRWGCDGVIAYVASGKAHERILSANIPSVLFDLRRPIEKLKATCRRNVTVITHDFKEEGRVAARYFLERHYRHFAYVGLEGRAMRPDIDRRDGFAEELSRHGFYCTQYPRSPDGTADAFSDKRINLSRWLSNLPRATGLFAMRDMRALDIIAAAANGDIHIPKHVAILGFDNDELICETCSPTLSSISADISSLGYEGAKQLDRLMAGHKGEVIVRSPKLKPVTRASTEMDAIGDPFVSRSLTWIRAHLSDDLSIDTIAKDMRCSKRLLQKRYQKVLGCSLGQEIRRQRLEMAVHLLKTTNDDLTKIALACGFSSASHLCWRIKKATGQTPGYFRTPTEMNAGSRSAAAGLLSHMR